MNRAGALANRFSLLSQEFIKVIEGCTPAQMRAACAGERCTVAALGAHVAGVHQLATDWIQRAASSLPLPPVTMADIDEANERQFKLDAGRPKHEVLEVLRANGAQASRLVRGLSEQELDQTTYSALFGTEVTTEYLIRNVLIADVEIHLASIKSAVREQNSSVSTSSVRGDDW
jgi:hypothetical protein